MYGCESWISNENLKRTIEACEMEIEGDNRMGNKDE